MANTDYGAIPLTIAEATSVALNTKLGVSTGFKPSEWANAIASIPSGGGEDYDYIIKNHTFAADHFINTGLNLYTSDNLAKNWYIDLDVTPADTSNRFILGFGRNTGAWANTWNIMNKAGITSYNYLNFIKDTAVSLGTNKIRIVKDGTYLRFYTEGGETLIYSDNKFNNAAAGAATHCLFIGGGTTNNDGGALPYFNGTVNKFGFKWVEPTT